MKLHLRYIVAAAGYMTAIFLMSSVPEAELGLPGSPRIWNLLHIPLFAGLATCLILGVNNGDWRRRIPGWLYVAIALVGMLYAGLEEWHQTSVAGRHATIVDFLLNVTGIAGLLFLHYRFARRQRADS